MTLFIIMVPLMVAAIAIATVPILYHSVREDRLLHSGSAKKPKLPVDTGYSIRKVSPDQRKVRPSGQRKVAA
jgi:hypothetical protein